MVPPATQPVGSQIPTSWFPDTQTVGSHATQPDGSQIPNQLVPRYPSSWFPDTQPDDSQIPNQLVPMPPDGPAMQPSGRLFSRPSPLITLRLTAHREPGMV